MTPSALESGLAKLRDAHRDWCGIGLSTEKGLSDEEVAALLAKIEAADRLAESVESEPGYISGYLQEALADYRAPQPAGGGES